MPVFAKGMINEVWFNDIVWVPPHALYMSYDEGLRLPCKCFGLHVADDSITNLAQVDFSNNPALKETIRTGIFAKSSWGYHANKLIPLKIIAKRYTLLMCPHVTWLNAIRKAIWSIESGK